MNKQNRTGIEAFDERTDQIMPVRMKDGCDSDIFITLAKPEDLADIVAIYNENITSKIATADLQPIKVIERQDWFDQHLNNPARPIYVIKNRAGELMAWGSFSDYKSRFAYHISSEISIYVSHKYHRRKLASLLLKWMLEQAPKLGIHNVIALIFAHNKPSINLFQRFDFETWGRLPKVCDMGDFLADVIIMGKQNNG